MTYRGVCSCTCSDISVTVCFFVFFCQSAFFVDLSLITVSVGIGVLHLTQQVHIWWDNISWYVKAVDKGGFMNMLSWQVSASLVHSNLRSWRWGNIYLKEFSPVKLCFFLVGRYEMCLEITQIFVLSPRKC